MHEGLLILDKPKKHGDPRSVMFCNRPASKLINVFLGKWNGSGTPEQTDVIL